MNGVKYLHEHDIVHRDLKYVLISASCIILALIVAFVPCRPENILYRTRDKDSDIVIADFGMSVSSAPLVP